MTDRADAHLSTAQLAARTGLPAGTLRMWETRHGFPSPSRLPGGHRRYTDSDADAVSEVLSLRHQGLSLPAAIERVRRHRGPEESSVFAGLRRRRPDLGPAVLNKRALLGISHAIEDEYLARGGGGTVFGSFQRERFYRVAEHRWRELDRTAELAVVVADFHTGREPESGPVEVALPPRLALHREWTVIVDAPGAHACLAAWELPGDGDLADLERRFELIWSFEPEVVRTATEIAAALLWAISPEVARRMPDPERLGMRSADMRFAGALTGRIIAYLGALVEP